MKLKFIKAIFKQIKIKKLKFSHLKILKKKNYDDVLSTGAKCEILEGAKCEN